MPNNQDAIMKQQALHQGHAQEPNNFNDEIMGDFYFEVPI